MAATNSPNRITLDAFSDPQLETYGTNGSYSRFTNNLNTPILGAKSFELISATFINSCLQLNDQSQLVFYYYASATQAGIQTNGNLKCVRLHPSNFIPYPGWNGWVKNKYWNTVTELVTALNLAASTGGDSMAFNPIWLENGIIFSYDSATRKISVSSNSASIYICPAAYDDPRIIQAQVGTIIPNSQLRMNSYNAGNTWATAIAQPYVANITMNTRIGFAMSYYSRPAWGSSSSQAGLASQTQVPQIYQTLIEADTFPILLGAQSVGIYLDCVIGGGYDSVRAKNLLAPVFINVPPLNIVSYVPASVSQPLVSVPSEIYSITVYLVDEQGVPFVQPPNYDVRVEISIGY
jgi:hypothetical protein